jgi:hypothetical protein
MYVPNLNNGTEVLSNIYNLIKLNLLFSSLNFARSLVFVPEL